MYIYAYMKERHKHTHTHKLNKQTKNLLIYWTDQWGCIKNMSPVSVTWDNAKIFTLCRSSAQNYWLAPDKGFEPVSSTLIIWCNIKM